MIDIEMRRIVVDVLDMAKASNEAEKAIATENATLKTENDRLSKQNLELFNRVTTSISPTSKTQDDDKEEKDEVTTDDILSYYS